MQKTSIFEGNFTTLHEEDATDIFYDITNILMRGFAFEFKDKKNVDFMISLRNQTFVVTTNLRPVLSLKMMSCEKESAENLFDRVKVFRDFDIDEDEWIAVLANDKKLREMQEPKKRIFKFIIELTMPESDEEECREFYEVGQELLQNIQ